MRLTKLITALIFAGFLANGYAIAADSTQPADAIASSKLEKISDAPAAAEHDTKECPMHKGKKESEHKNGEPCPYHQDEKHLGKSHQKCDHKQHG